MTLISILLTLAIEKLKNPFHGLKEFTWFSQYSVWLQGKFTNRPWFNSAWGVLLTVTPVVILTGLIQNTLARGGGFIWWLLLLLYSVLVLLICIRYRSLTITIKDYIDAFDRDDEQGAYLYVEDIIREYETENEPQLHQKVIEAMLEMTNERLMAILFWFVVLGPVGAVTYRITVQLHRQTKDEEAVDGLNEAATRLKAILDWLPARITAVIFAVAGSFVDSLHSWKECSAQWRDNWVASNRGVLVASGTGALNFNHLETTAEEFDKDVAKGQLLQALALVRRSVIVSLTLLAFMTLGGWLV